LLFSLDRFHDLLILVGFYLWFLVELTWLFWGSKRIRSQISSKENKIWATPFKNDEW
jgi:hypothetical protein